VFGLNESLRPTLKDMNGRLDDPEILHGIPRHWRTRDAEYLRLQEASDRRDQWCGRGHRRDDDAGDGRPARVGESADWFCVRQDRYTPEACSSWFLPRIVGMSQALEWVYTADPSPRKRRNRVDW